MGLFILFIFVSTLFAMVTFDKTKLTTPWEFDNFCISKIKKSCRNLNVYFKNSGNSIKQAKTRRSAKTDYIYRDYGNYRFWGEFWLTDMVLRNDLEPFLFEGTQFVPVEVGVPSLMLAPRNDDDHWFHSIEDILPDTAISPSSLVLDSTLFFRD